MDCLCSCKKEVIRLPYISHILFILLFHTLFSTICSGSVSVSIINKYGSETPDDSVLNAKDGEIIIPEFEKEIRSVNYTHSDRKRSLDNYGTYYSQPKSEYTDWQAMLERERKAKEYQERQEEEEEKRRKEKEEEARKRVTRNKIAVGVAITLTIIGVTIWVYKRVQYDATQRTRRSIQQANDAVAISSQLDNRSRQIFVVDVHTRIPLRDSAELFNNEHRSGQEQSRHIDFAPNLYYISNISNNHNLPSTNFPGNSNENDNHDLPPSYEEAVGAVQPRATPAENRYTSGTKI